MKFVYLEQNVKVIVEVSNDTNLEELKNNLKTTVKSTNEVEALSQVNSDWVVNNVHEITERLNMTKKEFKEYCSFHVYGNRRRKLNAIYFGWQSDPENNAVGYKYMVKATTDWCSKKELFNALYDWITKEKQPDWYIDYRYAMNEQDRFKVKLSESF